MPAGGLPGNFPGVFPSFPIDETVKYDYSLTKIDLNITNILRRSSYSAQQLRDFQLRTAVGFISPNSRQGHTAWTLM
jgi:hypothetical protein